MLSIWHEESGPYFGGEAEAGLPVPLRILRRMANSCQRGAKGMAFSAQSRHRLRRSSDDVGSLNGAADHLGKQKDIGA